jgi:hypothetical protein
MDKKLAAAGLVVLGAVLCAAAFYVLYAPQATTPAAQDEFSVIDDWLSELDDFLDFENQTFDFDLEEITENWG